MYNKVVMILSLNANLDNVVGLADLPGIEATEGVEEEALELHLLLVGNVRGRVGQRRRCLVGRRGAAAVAAAQLIRRQRRRRRRGGLGGLVIVGNALPVEVEEGLVAVLTVGARTWKAAT